MEYDKVYITPEQLAKKIELPSAFIYKHCQSCIERQKLSNHSLWSCDDCQLHDENICTCKDDHQCQLCKQLECFNTNQVHWMRCYLREEFSEFKYCLCSPCLRAKQENPKFFNMCVLCSLGKREFCFDWPNDGRKYLVRCHKCRFCLQYDEYLREEEKKDQYLNFEVLKINTFIPIITI